VHDNLGLTSQLQVGQSFARALSDFRGEEGEPEAARDFLQTLLQSGYAFGLDTQVLLEGHPMALHFTGGVARDGVLIVGQEEHEESTHLVKELMLINNETVNALRAALKRASSSASAPAAPVSAQPTLGQPTPAQNKRDNELLVELSRANNDLMALQRELAKKNALLSQTVTALENAQAALKRNRPLWKKLTHAWPYRHDRQLDRRKYPPCLRPKTYGRDCAQHALPNAAFAAPPGCG
jgi:hypothetical protein